MNTIQTHYDVGTIFKYHNAIVRVVRKSEDRILCTYHFSDRSSGNLLFSIPVEKIEKIPILPISSKANLKALLKNLSEDEANIEEELFGLNGLALADFSLEQATEAIKILSDEKNLTKDGISANKASKLAYFRQVLVREMIIAFEKPESWAEKQVDQSIRQRATRKR